MSEKEKKDQQLNFFLTKSEREALDKRLEIVNKETGYEINMHNYLRNTILNDVSK